MTKDEALKLALEALEGVLDDAPKVMDASIAGGLYEVVQCRDAITAIREALAQPVQEPVGYVYWSKGHAEGAIDVQTLNPGTPLYTSPPQRKPLTDEEIDALANNNGTVDLVTWWRQLARAIEAAHNIKERNK